LATNSGGAFFEGTTESLTDSYGAIREAIHNVWTLDFSCPNCNRDGESYRLQANLSDNERVLSDGQAIRLLPSAALETTRKPGARVSDPGAEAKTSIQPDAAEPKSSAGSTWSWFWLVLPLLAAVAAGWLVWQRRSHETAVPEPEPDDLPAIEPLATPTYTTESGIVTNRPPRPAKLRVVRLLVVRGKKPGQQYSVTLLEKAVVGARSTCDCVLFDEPGVAPEQFELYQTDGQVFIKNLSEGNPTLIDGLPIESQHRIQSEALVGTHSFIVRVIFGEGRATAQF
jgi:hypothetical protein